MKKYLAMCRLHGATTPSKLHIEAVNVLDAIKKMCETANVVDTHAFSAYEILEVVENGDAYVPVASKDSASVKETRLRRMASRNLPGLEVAPPNDPIADSLEEPVEPGYEPYEVVEAA